MMSDDMDQEVFSPDNSFSTVIEANVARSSYEIDVYDDLDDDEQERTREAINEAIATGSLGVDSWERDMRVVFESDGFRNPGSPSHSDCNHWLPSASCAQMLSCIKDAFKEKDEPLLDPKTATEVGSLCNLLNLTAEVDDREIPLGLNLSPRSSLSIPAFATSVAEEDWDCVMDPITTSGLKSFEWHEITTLLFDEQGQSQQSEPLCIDEIKRKLIMGDQPSLYRDDADAM
eukprot:CAMPEP_0116578116 /NCGR_PEP_ID=MMETSP0397-20121206/21519_1 /TAXON_ID=216820 /ORGANISM="Cyclophora tenuis, Strain ECT3854" /LENGTH=230 /DNA_ID=CAMNT_0004107453 /DNA_START=109 /DNA_END=801 /DNA_ORIENTATION=+